MINAISRCIRGTTPPEEAENPQWALEFSVIDAAFRAHTINWQAAEDLLGVEKSKIFAFYSKTYRPPRVTAITYEHKNLIEQQIVAEF